jgi:PP-loop superfamily ATP-utilizing enzyme
MHELLELKIPFKNLDEISSDEIKNLNITREKKNDVLNAAKRVVNEFKRYGFKR